MIVESCIWPVPNVLDLVCANKPREFGTQPFPQPAGSARSPVSFCQVCFVRYGVSEVRWAGKQSCSVERGPFGQIFMVH